MFGLFHFIVLVIVFVISMIPAWKIVTKAGYSGPLCLLLIVPLVNIIMVWVFAFADWPALKRQ